MIIKEITLSLSRKMPIPGVQYSNKEAGYHITFETSEEDTLETIRETVSRGWEKVKQEVSVGLDEDQQQWLQPKLSEQKAGDDNATK